MTKYVNSVISSIILSQYNIPIGFQDIKYIAIILFKEGIFRTLYRFRSGVVQTQSDYK